jgi:replicative DNA helicase
VNGVDQQRRFLDVVGSFGPRSSQAEVLRMYLRDRVANTNVDTLPAAAFVRVQELMAEQGSPVRASQLPLDRQAAIARYAWPGNQDELRTAAIRIGAYVASACNLSAAARTLGLHHSTLRESLERCGAIE